MPQLSLYLDDRTMNALRENAAAEHMSMSKYASRCIAWGNSRSAWPADFWNLYGSIEDETFERPTGLSPELDTADGDL